MRNMLLAFLMSCSLLSAFAQQKSTVDISAETRMGYHHDEVDGKKNDSSTGIKGDYLNLKINGTIDEHFSYSWRQRFNKKISDSHYFDATDWIYITYAANQNWSLSAGKQVVLIGGYEYGAAPVDVFMASEYWQNIPCYQFGGSVTYTTKSGNDKFTAQLCESPFRTDKDNDLMAYNLFWTGNHGPWSTLWSANMIAYAPGKYISYIALGNKITTGNLCLELDLMNRATDNQAFLFRDCSVIGKLMWQCTPQLELYTKASYDVNRTHHGGDLCVMPGTELTSLGGGVEYCPIKNNKHTVRLHACASYTTGTNSNPSGTLVDKYFYLNAGVTWKFHILSWGK